MLRSFCGDSWKGGIDRLKRVGGLWKKCNYCQRTLEWVLTQSGQDRSPSQLRCLRWNWLLKEEYGAAMRTYWRRWPTGVGTRGIFHIKKLWRCDGCWRHVHHKCWVCWVESINGVVKEFRGELNWAVIGGARSKGYDVVWNNVWIYVVC